MRGRPAMEKRSSRPRTTDRGSRVVVGIAGGSGSGKTALARALAAALGEDRALLLSQDAYYRDLSHLPLAKRARANFDEPAALDAGLLARHLAALRRGEAVSRPAYDFVTHARLAATVRADPRPFLVLDGTLVLSIGEVAAELDFAVFVDLEDGKRLARRLARDVARRGRSAAGVRAQWAATVRPMHALHVEPGRARADLVVRGDAPLAESVARVVACLGR